jgi:hypothetical protein
MCGADLVELWRRCVPSALNFEELSTFQALLYISARAIARAGLFMKRQFKYLTSEGCGLKSQEHFLVANIINSDWIGEIFQLQYRYVMLIRRVCVRRYSGLVCTENCWTPQSRQSVSANIRPLLRTLNNSHLTLRYRLLSNVLQYWLTDCMEQSASGQANIF